LYDLASKVDMAAKVMLFREAANGIMLCYLAGICAERGNPNATCTPAGQEPQNQSDAAPGTSSTLSS
jgi:hypothetical protein